MIHPGIPGKASAYVERAIPIGGVQGHAGFAGRLQEGEPRAPPPGMAFDV